MSNALGRLDISTGVYPYPQREAADTAIATIAAELAAHALPRKVILCTYDFLATVITTEAFNVIKAQAGRRHSRSAPGSRPSSPQIAVSAGRSTPRQVRSSSVHAIGQSMRNIASVR